MDLAGYISSFYLINTITIEMRKSHVYERFTLRRIDVANSRQCNHVSAQFFKRISTLNAATLGQLPMIYNLDKLFSNLYMVSFKNSHSLNYEKMFTKYTITRK